jgi:phage gp29-like protein
MRVNDRILDYNPVAEALTQNLPNKLNRKFKKQIATRKTSGELMWTAITGALPNPDPVLKKLGKDMDVYEDLKYDSRVQAVMKSRKAATKKRKWDIIGENTPESEIKFHKERYEKYNMEDIISEILDYFWFGYKPLEILWDTDNWVPVDLVGKPSRWFTYDEDNNLRFLSADEPLNGLLVPPDKFIVARNEASYDNPYGEPVASPCYWPVIFRKNGMSFWFTLVEKYGIPWVLTRYDEGTKEKRVNEVCDKLEELVLDGIIATPKTWETELISGNANQGKSESMQKTFLDFQNTEIAMAVLGTNLTTEVQGGSFAASQSHMEVRDDIVDADSGKVEEVFNEEIAITHRMHFTSEPPKMRLYAEEKIDVTRADRDLKIQQGNPGFKFTERYYQDKYNLEEDEFELTDIPIQTGEQGDDSK